MCNLASALADLKSEVLAGQTAAEAAAEIATEYGVNPVLLVRKFTESYRSEDALRATAQATNPVVMVAEKTARKITELCARYQVAENYVKRITYRGDTFRVICKRANTLVMVRERDGWHCNLNARAPYTMIAPH